MTETRQADGMAGEAAVCLWFYRRADNVRTILSRVARYRPRRLYLVSDGPNPKHPDDAALVAEARLAARESVTWPCEVRHDYSEVNLGVRRRIPSAIDWVFREEEQAIFLEDDTIPSASFFPFCEEMLTHYRDDPRVMLISGSNPLSGRMTAPHGYLFSRFFHIWGWACWRRVWQHYDPDMRQWPAFKLNDALRAHFDHAGMLAWISRLFDGVQAGRIETWDVQLFFACLFNNGVAVVPGRNLVSNVGYDGVHYSGGNNDRMLGVPEEEIDCRALSHPRYISPSRHYDRLLMDEFFPLPPARRQPARMAAKTRHFAGRLLRALCPSRERELLRMAWQGRRVHARARRLGLHGEAFHRFGRALGWRLWLRDHQDAALLLRRPVGSTRYFEFDFAWRALRSDGFSPTAGLDVSSPFLFGFHAVKHIPGLALRMLNPDHRDLRHSMRIARALNWRAMQPVAGGVEALDEVERRFDVVWSLSVVEHIAEDSKAVQRMWRVLRPGGRLILTVPTDKRFWDEYRDGDPYGTQPRNGADGRCFFQRFYDEAAIRSRIVAAIGVEPARMEWFGEKVPGHFHDYIARWRREGSCVTLMDPLDIARNYRSYASFGEMPGAGVCGLLFIKPGDGRPAGRGPAEDCGK